MHELSSMHLKQVGRTKSCRSGRRLSNDAGIDHLKAIKIHQLCNYMQLFRSFAVLLKIKTKLNYIVPFDGEWRMVHKYVSKLQIHQLEHTYVRNKA